MTGSVHSGLTASIPVADLPALIARLEVYRIDHLRLATWNNGKDRPVRVAFHHEAAIDMKSAIAILRAIPDGYEAEGGVNQASLPPQSEGAR